MKILKFAIPLLVVLSLILSCIPISAQGYNVAFEVMSTSPIGATVRATIDGSPQNVQMVVLNLQDIQSGVSPQNARQQEIKYTEVNQITLEDKEYRTGIMGDRDITIDDVIAKASPDMLPMSEENQVVTPKYSTATTDYLNSVKNSKSNLKVKTALNDEFKKAPKAAKSEIEAIMAEMPDTIRDIVGYDVKVVKEEVKSNLVKNKSPTKVQSFSVPEPMVLEATVTSGARQDAFGWCSSGVLALIIDDVYYYDMSNSSWWSTAYAYRIPITIDHTKIDATLTNYPVYINISASSGITNADVTAIFDELGANGLKIVLTDVDSTVQYYMEEVTWDSGTETAEIWAGVPSASHTTDTDLWLYFDNSQADNSTYVGVTGSVPGKAVWDANFIEVLHMNDGVDNAHVTGSKTGTSYAKKGANEPVEASGIIGKAQNLDGGDDYIGISASTVLANLNNSTVEAIIKADSVAGDRFIYCESETAGPDYFLRITGTRLQFAMTRPGYNPATGTTALGTVNNYYLAGSQSVTTGKVVYVNGLSDGTNANTEPLGHSIQEVALGRYIPAGGFYDGLTDELRISNIARPDAHIKANNYNWTDDLVTFGAVETPPPPTVHTDAADTIMVDYANIYGEITDTGGFDCSEWGFEWDIDSGAPYANSFSVALGGYGIGTYGTGLSGLTFNTQYFYRFFAINTAGTTYGNELNFTTLFPLPLAPTNLTLTQTGTNSINIDWVKGTYATTTVIRASSDNFPTSLTEGFEIYNNTGITDSETGISLGIDTYYVSAWSHNATGYSITYAQNKIGGSGMALIFLLGFPAILMLVGTRSSYWLFKVLSGFAWLPLGFYLNAHPISSDNNIQQIQWLVILGVVLGCLFWGFWTSKSVNGNEVSRFRLPFSQSDEQLEEERISRARSAPTRRERIDAYKARLNSRTSQRKY